MPARRPTFRALDRCRRLLAAGAAALVLALTIFAASPTAHAWLHAEAPAHAGHKHCPDHDRPAEDTEHGCAVVLFAGGVSLPVAPAALVPPRVRVQGIAPATAAEFYLVSPRYLRQPERGPPAGRIG
jgi:hypothetical protein